MKFTAAFSFVNFEADCWVLAH